MSRAERRARTLGLLEPYVERARRFSGWRFDDVGVTPLEPGPPWDYASIAHEHAGRSERLLDLGTGGGEILTQIVAGLAVRVVAT